MGRREGVRQQYEAWPYPHYPLLASVRRIDTWQLSVDYLYDRCGSGIAPRNPRIWIAGCGTFQPYTMGLANPRAHVWATDNSVASLRAAKRRCGWQGVGNVDFARVDLEDESTWPDGPFEYIECYGVLMNLTDPGRTLRAMARRLAEGGVLRIMVYPHYSRRRIFQIQRVARLLGLHFRDRRHPKLLRRVLTALPEGHPLRYAFETYPDSANHAGVVDGFLHAGDRGFTGEQLGELIRSADLTPAFFMHRPWGQPAPMAERLQLDDRRPEAVLDHLDRWQELRTNLVVCLRRIGDPTAAATPLRLHPHLDPWQAGLPIPQRLRTLLHRWFGVTLPCRTSEHDLQWSSRELAVLARAAAGELGSDIDQCLVARAMAEGILLGGTRPPAPKVAYDGPPVRSGTGPDGAALALGDGVPNPFYAHLFAAWHSDPEPERWHGVATPLESEGQFGLTPYGTWRARREIVAAELRKATDGSSAPTTAASYAEVAYSGETEGRARVARFLAHFQDLPHRPRTDAEERELWILLGSHDQLTLDARPRHVTIPRLTRADPARAECDRATAPATHARATPSAAPADGRSCAP